MSHLTEIIRFNEEENEKNDIIYQLLKKELIESLNIYNLGNNLFGVYFVHIIKYLTGSLIRQNEIKENLVLEKFKSETIRTFPFFGYYDLKSKKLNNKSFGLNIKKKFKIKSQIFNYINIFNNKKFYADVLGILSKDDMNKFSNDKKIYIHKKTNKFFFENLDQQIIMIKEIIRKIHKDFNFEINEEIFVNLFEKHIRKNCFEGLSEFKFYSDKLITNGLVDTYNRMIASKAKKYGIKIINFDHGYSSGLFDDQILFNETLYTDYFITYGDFLKNNIHKYNEIHNKKIKILSFTKKYNVNLKNLVNLKNKKVIYYPTTLRTIKRFGPYIDMNLKNYLKLQKHIFDNLDRKVTIKLHPKDNTQKIIRNFHGSNYNYSEINLYDSFKICKVAIFDFPGTAFFEAIDNNIPVIFINNYQRKFPKFVLEKLKELCFIINLDELNKLKSINNFKINPNKQNLFSQSLAKDIQPIDSYV